MAWVLDSMDKDPETYKDFLTILKSAFRHYRTHLDGKPNTRNTDKLFIKQDSLYCHKQRIGSGHCGYYVMEFMNATGTYKRHPELAQGPL
ncbi:hypothetical protein ACP4OV_014390 [Aristida adscensionis]